MLFLHKNRRDTDVYHRRATDGRLEIIGSEGDLEFEVWQLRQDLAFLRHELDLLLEQAAYRDDEWCR